jgi:hypothetical protein
MSLLQGHTVETFRLHEAIAAGSIPVIHLEGGEAREHLPREFFESPILFVEAWSDLPKLMVQLLADSSALQKRQSDLLTWYDAFMKRTVAGLESILESR